MRSDISAIGVIGGLTVKLKEIMNSDEFKNSTPMPEGLPLGQEEGFYLGLNFGFDTVLDLCTAFVVEGEVTDESILRALKRLMEEDE